MDVKKNILFSLREYQKNATQKINNIYNNENYNRLACVVLPTGGGKSFIAIEQMLSANGVDYHSKNGNDEINSAKMIYIAPTKDILSQLRIHILRHVIFNIPNIENMSISDIDKLLKKDYNMSRFKGLNSDKNKKILPDNAGTQEKISRIISLLTPKDIKDIVYKAFPNLKMICYAGAKAKEGKTDKHDSITKSDIEEAKYIFLDEAHKSVTEEYGKYIEEVIKTNGTKANGKILAITATPDRADNIQTMRTLAKYTYGEDARFNSQDYMAEEIHLLDATREGLIIAPKIEHFNSALAFSEEYEEILNKYLNERYDINYKNELRELLDKMEETIEFSRRKFEESGDISGLENAKNVAIGEKLRTTISNPYGKYIAFIPPNTQGIDTEDYLKKQKTIIEEHFNGLKDKDGNPIKIKVTYVTSDKKVQSDDDCSEVLKAFENDDNDCLRILMAVGKLDEGIHVEGIDGCIMYKSVDKARVFLQESGRGTSSMNPRKPYEAHKKTIVYDVVGNTMRRANAKDTIKSSFSHDLEVLEKICDWIKANNKIPNINKDFNEVTFSQDEMENMKDEQIIELKKAKAQEEARLAISLKRILKKYNGNIDITPSTRDTIEKIKKILDEKMGNSKLRNILIEERNIKPSEKELSGEDFLELSEKEKEFMKIYQHALTIKPKRTWDAQRVSNLISILSILKEKDKPLYFHSGIVIGKGDERKSTKDVKHIDLQEYISEKYKNDRETYEKIASQIKTTVSDVLEKNYDIGEELAYVRGLVYTSKSFFTENGYTPFDGLEPKLLVDLGIIEPISLNQEKIPTIINNLHEAFGIEYKSFQKNRGFLTKTDIGAEIFTNRSKTPLSSEFGMIQSIERINMIDGTEYRQEFQGDDKAFDAYGYDKDGYDKFGFDRFGFNKDHINKDTGTNTDRRGFYYDTKEGKYLNKFTKGERDLLGYNVQGIDKNGFERPQGLEKVRDNLFRYIKPRWHRKEKDGTYSQDTEMVCLDRASEYYGLDSHKFMLSRTSGGYGTYKGETRKYANPSGFLSNGTVYSKYTLERNADIPCEKELFYSKSDQDIDGYDKNGFKKVEKDGKVFWINRDTSRTYDKRGKYVDKEGRLKDVKELRNAKIFIHILLGTGGSMERLKTHISDKCQQNGKAIDNEGIEQIISDIITKAFTKIYINAPDAFNPEGRFLGLDKYFGNEQNNEKINELYSICPALEGFFRDRTEELKRRIGILSTEKDKLEKTKDLKSKKRITSLEEQIDDYQRMCDDIII